ncbi:ubiquitin elongating factor core-domain-containing protein [Chytriomyces cf. hyalinus JEL632]|nr:ubiquitin elongating factor core-domain-containing protein [Chytriomyces cf. hyalinus JEL632]
MDGTREEQDEIRAKRLAKMSNSGQNSGSNSNSELNTNQVETPAKPAAKGLAQTPVKAQIQSQSKASSNASIQPSSPSNAHAKAISVFMNASSASWEHQTMAYVFAVEVDVNVAKAKNFVYLSSLVEDLQADLVDHSALTADLADRIIHARLSRPENAEALSPSNPALFDYLVSCWKRSREAHKRINDVLEKSKLPGLNADTSALVPLANSRIEILTKTRELIVNYTGLVLNPDMGDLFPQNNDVLQQGAGYMASKLLMDAYASEEQLPSEFLKEFISRFENDGLEEFIGPIVNSITAAMRFQDITTDYMTPIRAITILTSHKSVASKISKLSNWLPANMQPRTFELLTILGPFFAKPCVFSDETGKLGQNYFSSANVFGENIQRDREGMDIGNRNLGDVESAMTNLRATISTVQSNLHGLTMAMIRAGPDTKEDVLKFFSEAISLNHARARIQVDPKAVATDGFMFNIGKTCLSLCEPIMDANFSKIQLIEPYHFLRPTPRLIQPASTSLMFADDDFLNAQKKKWLEENPNAPAANFVTDVFILTLGSLHLGYMGTVRQYQNLIRQIGDLKKEVDRMKAERDTGAWAGSPDAAMKEFTLKRYQTQLDVWIAQRLVTVTSLLDKVTVDQITRFYNLVMMWLMRVILVGAGTKVGGINWSFLARGNLNQGGAQILPLPVEVPAMFATLPEWIFEDIVEFYIFVSRYKATLFEGTLRDEFMLFSVSMLQTSGYIKNPHLKSKLIEVLYSFTHPLYRNASGEAVGSRLDVIFSTHEAAKQYLVPGIMRFYVDAEFTGDSRAFYDKFTIRFYISQILKSIWDDQNHRNVVVQESQKEEFIKFANLLMNDTRYLLDEALTMLAQIHKIHQEMSDVQTWNSLPQNIREDKEKNLRDSERGAQGYLQLGNETVNMFLYLTAEERIVVPFMAPYLVERLAAMLDYNLTTMVGPKCTELKVKNPEKYGFDPKSLLTKLVEIFLHLAHRSEFIQAVARDERSYRKEIFYRACDILARNGLKNSGELDMVRQFVSKVEEAIRNSQAEDEELGDVPDEFLDPLLAHLMEDPVILPTSNITVDRSTIITQLLSNPLDPFNRKPLTIDMVVPDVELKNKIAEWKRQQRSGKATPMETD